MRKIFISILFLTIVFAGCQNNQQNIEEQQIDSVTITETDSSVSENIQKETNYFPAIDRFSYLGL